MALLKGCNGNVTGLGITAKLRAFVTSLEYLTENVAGYGDNCWNPEAPTLKDGSWQCVGWCKDRVPEAHLVGTEVSLVLQLDTGQLVTGTALIKRVVATGNYARYQPVTITGKWQTWAVSASSSSASPA